MCDAVLKSPCRWSYRSGIYNCSAKRIMYSTLFLFRKLEFWMGVKILALVEVLVPMYLYQIRPLKVTTDVLQEFWSKKSIITNTDANPDVLCLLVSDVQ